MLILELSQLILIQGLNQFISMQVINQLIFLAVMNCSQDFYNTKIIFNDMPWKIWADKFSLSYLCDFCPHLFTFRLLDLRRLCLNQKILIEASRPSVQVSLRERDFRFRSRFRRFRKRLAQLKEEGQLQSPYCSGKQNCLQPSAFSRVELWNFCHKIV
jgi:hypothetical protein